MTGSIADGEDVVQETLARACFELPQLKELPLLRPWLFRIAHHRAIDHWRHESLRASEPLDAALDVADAAALEPDHVVARQQAVRAAVSSFLALAPAQRGCVILKDVLEHSIDEIAAELGLSVAAVKAALHRGRAALHKANAAALPAARPPMPSPALKRYAGLFNAHDWDGVRSLLADDVRLDLVLAAQGRRPARRRQLPRQLSAQRRLAHGSRLVRRPRSARGPERRRGGAAALLHRARLGTTDASSRSAISVTSPTSPRRASSSLHRRPPRRSRPRSHQEPRHEDRAVLSAADRDPDRAALDPGRDRLRDDARRADAGGVPRRAGLRRCPRGSTVPTAPTSTRSRISRRSRRSC